jgi:hypothetical protein
MRSYINSGAYARDCAETGRRFDNDIGGETSRDVYAALSHAADLIWMHNLSVAELQQAFAEVEQSASNWRRELKARYAAATQRNNIKALV